MSADPVPARFSEVRLQGTDLHMVLLSCPGVRFFPSGKAVTVSFLKDDLQRLRDLGVRMLLSCLSEPELTLGKQCFGDAVAACGIEWRQIAIPDMQPPGAELASEIEAAFAAARVYFASGHPIAIHCMAGLGRTGTIAACLAMTYGLSVAEAIAFIRRAHDRDAIETVEQVAYLHQRQPVPLLAQA